MGRRPRGRGARRRAPRARPSRRRCSRGRGRRGRCAAAATGDARPRRPPAPGSTSFDPTDRPPAASPYRPRNASGSRFGIIDAQVDVHPQRRRLDPAALGPGRPTPAARPTGCPCRRTTSPTTAARGTGAAAPRRRTVRRTTHEPSSIEGGVAGVVVRHVVQVAGAGVEPQPSRRVGVAEPHRPLAAEDPSAVGLGDERLRRASGRSWQTRPPCPLPTRSTSQLTGPGGAFEVVVEDVAGRPTEVYKERMRSLREIPAMATRPRRRPAVHRLRRPPHRLRHLRRHRQLGQPRPRRPRRRPRRPGRRPRPELPRSGASPSGAPSTSVPSSSGSTAGGRPTRSSTACRTPAPRCSSPTASASSASSATSTSAPTSSTSSSSTATPPTSASTATTGSGASTSSPPHPAADAARPPRSTRTTPPSSSTRAARPAARRARSAPTAT